MGGKEIHKRTRVNHKHKHAEPVQPHLFPEKKPDEQTLTLHVKLKQTSLWQKTPLLGATSTITAQTWIFRLSDKTEFY